MLLLRGLVVALEETAEITEGVRWWEDPGWSAVWLPVPLLLALALWVPMLEEMLIMSFP